MTISFSLAVTVIAADIFFVVFVVPESRNSRYLPRHDASPPTNDTKLTVVPDGGQSRRGQAVEVVEADPLPLGVPPLEEQIGPGHRYSTHLPR